MKRKKYIYAALVAFQLFFIGYRANAQLNIGAGFGSIYDLGSSQYTQTPIGILTYDGTISEPGGSFFYGIGGYLSYFSSSYVWNQNSLGTNYSYSDKYTFEFIMARGTVHYKLSTTKFDPYGGLTLGYALAQHAFSTADPNYTATWDPGYSADHLNPANFGNFQFGLYLGARYYFSSVVGLYAELMIMNGGLNYLSAGITFNFNNAGNDKTTKKTTTTNQNTNRKY